MAGWTQLRLPPPASAFHHRHAAWWASMTRMFMNQSRRRAACGACETEGPDLPLELAQLGAKAGLPPVGLPHPLLMVGCHQGEKSGRFEEKNPVSSHGVALGEIELGEPAGPRASSRRASTSGSGGTRASRWR